MSLYPTPCVMAWDLAGRPDLVASQQRLVTTDQPAVCLMCGRTVAETAPAARAIGGNFTDQYLFQRPDSDRVCQACLWCCSGKPPATMRMWTVVAAPGESLDPSAEKAHVDGPGICLTSRGNTRPVIAVLSHPPAGEWAVSVAISGQKHVLPYARVNHGTGQWTVRMEQADVTATPDMWTTVLTAAATLRAAGHRADAIHDLTPDMGRIQAREDLDLWHHHAATLTPYRRAPLLGLALWTLTKETIHDHATDS